MMRNRAWLVAVLAFALGLSGCFVVSVNPLFRDRDLVFEPALAGSWTTACEKEGGRDKACRLRFDSPDQKTYSLEYTDEDGTTTKFDAYLGRIGKTLYLDVVPQDSERQGIKGSARDHALLVHSFWKLSLKKDELTLASLASNDALRRALRSSGMRVGTQRAGSGWVSNDDLLLGSTTELQRFFAAYAEQPEAWDTKPAVWRRQ